MVDIVAARQGPVVQDLVAQLTPEPSRGQPLPQGSVNGAPITQAQAQALNKFADARAADLNNWATIPIERVDAIKRELGRILGMPDLEPSRVSMQVGTIGGSGHITIFDKPTIASMLELDGATKRSIATINFPGRPFGQERTGS